MGMRFRRHRGEGWLRRACAALAAAAALSVCPLPGGAHHSYPPLLDEDGEEVIRVFEGSIELFRLLNPHSAMIINVADAGGVTADWLIEMSASFSLTREGWTDDTLRSGERVTIAVLASPSPNRGRLRAVLVHGAAAHTPGRLLVAYGIRGDTPVMRRLRERLPECADIETRLDRTACFSVDGEALLALQREFPGPMGYVMP